MHTVPFCLALPNFFPQDIGWLNVFSGIVEGLPTVLTKFFSNAQRVRQPQYSALSQHVLTLVLRVFIGWSTPWDAVDMCTFWIDGKLTVGGVIASKKDILVYPTRTNQIPRHIPPPHWASNPWVLFFAAGLLPFGTIFVELYFAMTSIWQVGVAIKILSLEVEHLFITRLVQSCWMRYLLYCFLYFGLLDPSLPNGTLKNVLLIHWAVTHVSCKIWSLFSSLMHVRAVILLSSYCLGIKRLQACLLIKESTSEEHLKIQSQQCYQKLLCFDQPRLDWIFKPSDEDVHL